jgi:hypothetical protein
MNMKSDVATINWEKLKAALKQETANMEQAAGETIIEVNLLSDYEVTLIHAKTRAGVRLTFSESMDSLRIENSAGVVNLTEDSRLRRLVDRGPSAIVIVSRPSRVK